MKFYHFVPTNDANYEGVPEPTLARDCVPDWYKRAEIAYTAEDGSEGNGLKTCVPFLDALISGYTLLTWADIHVRKLPDGNVDIDWDAKATSAPIMERPAAVGRTMPRPAGHLPNHLVWTPKWGIKSPKGFSSLIVHPLNRFDLPFTTSAGIIDSDNLHNSGNIPFFIKDDFEGIIPKGTPYAQIIPIKRESWTAVYDPALMEDLHEVGHKLRGVKRGWYRDKLWVKKEYNK